MQVPCYMFGDFELDPSRFELSRNGRAVKLERIPMELLILLLEKDGTVVSRQEIAERLWGQEVFVDTEHGINTAISKVRTALREDSERPRFIQTVPGKGYRFIAEKNARTVVPTPPSIGIAEPTLTVTPARKRNWWPVAIGLVSVLALTTTFLLVNWHRKAVITSHSQSIAVLPLANLSGDRTQDYFSDGMTDELITMLAKNTSLRVVSRTSAMQYKGVQRPVREIARELGVESILEGSITKAGNRVHLTVQLIHAPTDTHLWADSFDRDMSETYLLPSEVSRKIGQKLNATLGAGGAQRYVSPEAHDAYLRGRFFWFSEDYTRSQEYMEKAIQLQPDYAAAWSGVADTYAVRAVAAEVPVSEVKAKAEAASRKALELDDSVVEAHVTAAALQMFFNWDWKAADEESRRALELNPNYPEAHHMRAYLLTATNHLKEAVEEQKLSSKLDPFQRPFALGFVLIFAHQYDAAIAELNLRKEAQPGDFLVRYFLANAYRCKGMEKEWIAELLAAFELSGNTKMANSIRDAYRRGGEKAVAQWQLNHLHEIAKSRYQSPLIFAKDYARIRDRENTLKYLENAYQEHSPFLIFLQHEADFDFVHSDPRYRAIVNKIGLPPAY